MSKEFIPYEEALALKKLGFDEECCAWYFLIDGMENVLQKYADGNWNDDQFKQCSAPLYQQAFRWFRETYEHIATSDFNRSLGYKFEIDLHGGDSSCCTQWYATYEETELACLRKLIEIVNQNDE